MSTEELAERRRHGPLGRKRPRAGGRSRGARPWSYRAPSPFAAIQCAAELWGVHGRKSSRGARHVGARRRHKKTPPAKIVKPAGGENPIAHRARYTIYYSIQLPALQAEKR